MSKLFSFVLFLSLIWPNFGFAESQLIKTEQTASQPGVKKMRVGKAVMLVGVASGTALFLAGSMLGVMGDPNPNLSDEEIKEQRNRYSRRVAINSGALALTGLGIGTSLYVWGRSENNDWRNSQGQTTSARVTPRIEIVEAKKIGASLALDVNF